MSKESRLKTVSQNADPTVSNLGTASSSGIRTRRYFSEDMRIRIVKEIEDGIYNKSEACRVYSVSSAALYKWLHKYSVRYQKQIVVVTEHESESVKRKKLEQQVTDLQQVIGQMTVESIFYKELLTVISERYDIDFKKNINTKSYNDLEHLKALIKELSTKSKTT
jgi:transposase-like protein